MTAEEIQQTLAALHAELSHVSEVDDATRQRLEDVNADIDRILAAKDRSEPAAPIAENLQDLVAQFGAQHPKLTATVQQLVDRLSEIGI
jgi:ABC-type transporter Mla subunit MlaD